MKKIVSIVLVMVLLASAVPMAVTPAAATGQYEEKIPGDADENDELTKDELVNAILPYMLDEGTLKLDDVGDSAWAYAYWSGKPKAFTDIFEEDYIIYRPIERIVNAWPGKAQFLKVLDSTDRIIGSDSRTKRLTTLYPELSDATDCGGWGKPNFEQILSLQPDIYIPWVKSYAEPTNRNGILFKQYLERKLPGVKVLCIDGGEEVAGELVVEEVRRWGDLLDKEERAEEFIEFYEECLDTITDRTEGLSEDEKPKVLAISLSRSGFNPSSNSVYSTRFYIDLAGGKSIGTDLGAGYLAGTVYRVDTEWIIDRNPDFMFTRDNIYGAPKSPYAPDYPIVGRMPKTIAKVESITKSPLMTKVNASKNNNVHTIAYPHLHGTLANCIEVAYVAKLLHPELFKDLDVQAMHQEYVDRFLRIDATVNSSLFVYPPPPLVES
jgi:iron complex transport system substrate-binding protein